jgi:hypothetical protein
MIEFRMDLPICSVSADAIFREPLAFKYHLALSIRDR